MVVAIFKIEEGILTLAPMDDDTPKSFEAADKGSLYELRKVQSQQKNTELPKLK